ncbi:MAG: IPT/TIG domain-containing protein [Candidatus Solibacter sp.]
MKLLLPACVVCATILATGASAVTATFATTNETVTFAGLGGSAGVGQSRVTWGSCAFDGAETTCTVSANYTGVGGGGVFFAVLKYPGNGASPLTAISISPGSDRITFGLSAGTFTVSLKENTGATITFLSQQVFFDFLNATCTGVGACAAGQVGLTPGATISGRVGGTFDATPSIQTVISASNYGGFSAVAPATWMEIYGTNLANVLAQTWSGADFNGNTAPSALGATSVTIGGRPAFIYYVSPTQINAQVPSNLPSGPQPVVVSTPGGSSAASTVTVNPTQPGLLSPAVFKLASGQNVTALFSDNTTFVLPPGAIGGVASARAKPGDTIILYGVGFGAVTPDSPAGQIVTQSNRLSAQLQVSFAGTPATVSFAGLTGGYLGLYQFNVIVPNVAAGDAVPLTFTLGGSAGTQKLVIAISN